MIIDQFDASSVVSLILATIKEVTVSHVRWYVSVHVATSYLFSQSVSHASLILHIGIHCCPS